jgi:pimeloyl-ACP methyl ester carboxylesterase/uncharacterized membrane protein
MINFGFSYVGLIYLAMLFIPNGIWAKNQPSGYEEESKKENKILLAFERAGEVLLCVMALIFKDTNVRPGSLWLGWLILSFAAMVLYEIYWIRYFKSAKTLADMYSSIAGFPVAGASLPVIAFFLLGIYASNIFLIGASVIMGIGHIGIHMQHRKNAGIKPDRRKGVKIALGIIQIMVAIPVFIVIGVSIYFIAARNITWFSCPIDPFKGIEEQTYVEINGQKQFVSIRGNDRTNPVILFLHGGPMAPDSYVTYTYSNELIDDYTFVCWEQRGCGRTYFANPKDKNETVTFDQALEDVNAMADYLCDRFGCEKIIVMGHSYGTILGAEFAYNHPEKVAAYIGVGQFINSQASLESSFADALEIAEASGEDTTYMRKAYDTYLEEMSYESLNEANSYASTYHKAIDSTPIILAGLRSPYLASDDIKWFLVEADAERMQTLSANLIFTCMVVDIRTQTNYKVPVYFISGTDDWNCSYKVMAEYASSIGADYLLIEDANHTVQHDKPEEFTAAVKKFLAGI